MEVERRILRSTTVLLSAGVISQLANFAFVVYFARAYGPAVLGEYSFALSLGAVIAIFVSLGTNRFLLRKWSEDIGDWRSDVGLLLPAQVALAVLLGLAVLLAGRMLGIDPGPLRIIVTVVIFQLITAVWGLLAVGFTASERMGYGGLTDVGIRLSIMILGGVAIAVGLSPQTMLIILPVSGLVAAGILFQLARAEFGMPRFRWDAAGLSDLWRQSFVFFMTVALTIIYVRSGLLLLRGLSGPVEVGLFAPAERLVMAAGILHATFGSAIYPPLIRMARGDRNQFRKLADRAMRLMILVSLPIATVLFLFAEDIIRILFGTDFRGAGEVLGIVAWLVALRGVGTVLDRVGFADDRRRLLLLGKAAALACLLLLGSLLVPELGARGLAIALVISQALKTGFVGIGLARASILPATIRPSLPVLSACMLTILIALPVEDGQLWFRALTVGIAGLGLLWLFRAVERPDLLFLRRILGGTSLSPRAGRHS